MKAKQKEYNKNQEREKQLEISKAMKVHENLEKLDIFVKHQLF
jgi:hypothetical protein